MSVLDDLRGGAFGISEFVEHPLRLPSRSADLPVPLHSRGSQSHRPHSPEPFDVGVLNLDDGHSILASISLTLTPAHGVAALSLEGVATGIFHEGKRSPVKPGLTALAPEGSDYLLLAKALARVKTTSIWRCSFVRTDRRISPLSAIE